MHWGVANFSWRFLPKVFMPAAACVLVASSALAEQLPLWELGAGVAVIHFPHYRGSNERKSYVLPMPYVVYRGDFLKVDRQRIRGLFFHGDRTELDVSVSGSVPVRNNMARQGMPDLDPTLEIGPSLNVSLYEPESGKAQLELRLPLRSVLASDFTHVRDAGWMFQPQLNLDVHDLFDQQGLDMGVAVGPVFTDRRYNQYFYGVDAAYARPDRPAYTASGGYAGSQFIAALSKRFPKFWMGGFMKFDTLRGAVFEESPLVKSKQQATAGFAISWIFAESSTRVKEHK